MTEEKRKRVILALVTEPNKTKACQKAGISRKSLYRLMKEDDDFMLDYRDMMNTIVDDTVMEMKTAMRISAVELTKIITNEKETTENRLRAIRTAMEFGIRIAEKDNEIKSNMIDSVLEMMLNDMGQ